MWQLISYLRIGLGLTGLILFLHIALANVRLYLGWLAKGKNSSLTTFVGGVMGTLGWIVVFPPKSWWFAWVPLVLDIGCLPIFILPARNPRAESLDDEAPGTRC